MNKSEKEHLCQRIREIIHCKLVKAKVKRPDLHRHFVDAAKRGEAMRLRPAAEIIRHTGLIDTSRWNTKFELSLEQVFAPPTDYTRQAKAFEDDQEFLKRRNAPLLEKAEVLIDRIMLGVVKNPEAALAEAEGWKL